MYSLLSELKQKAFIELMKKSDEHARRGFDLLLKRQDFDTFFDAIAAQGLFAPESNPAVVVDESGRVRIPHWPALDYLLACARLSEQRNDLVLAEKVLKVVRAVTTFKDSGGVRDNFITFRRFAEILGVVPLSAITEADIELAAVWLSARFDHDMVARALDEGAFERLLGSDRAGDWKKATRLLQHCLRIVWEPAKGRSSENEPATIIDSHQLKDLIDRHSAAFGE